MERIERKTMRRILTALMIIFMAVGMSSCRNGETSPNQGIPPVWPDYIGVTVPSSIAPLDFGLKGDYDKLFVQVTGSKGGSIKSKGKSADFSIKRWHKLLSVNKGGTLNVTVLGHSKNGWTQWQSFDIYVSEDELDDYGVVYRKIAPGYETYSKIGLYQRNIHNFKESAIIESTLTPGQCVNCHTSNATDPEQYTFHLRGKHGGTYFQVGKNGKWVTTKTDSTISNSVYPYWHPSGHYCACSNNFIHQSFWTAKERLIEVWDDASDISVVDVRTDEVITSPLVHTNWYETYPAFSNDGKTLYYCTSYPYPVPARAEEVRYNLCSIDFDAGVGRFGERVDTLINAAARGRSVTFPRPSYDGRFILYSEADFGCFPIDHKEADLFLYEVATGSSWPLEEANSDYSESFHNWSSDSRWILFSSRRSDGLYSLLYFCHIDENGRASKPFLLPQRDPINYYGKSLYSYNVPDFTKKKVEFKTSSTWKEVSSPDRIKAKDKVYEFRIHGTVTDESLNGAQIFLVPLKNAVKENIDSVYIKDGRFEFRGTVERMSDIRLEMKRRIGYQNLLVVTEPGDINVNIGPVSSGGGTPQNDSLQIWKNITEERNRENAELHKTGMVNKNMQRRAEYRARTRQLAHNVGDSTTLGIFLMELFPESIDAKPQGK